MTNLCMSVCVCVCADEPSRVEVRSLGGIRSLLLLLGREDSELLKHTLFALGNLAFNGTLFVVFSIGACKYSRVRVALYCTFR